MRWFKYGFLCPVVAVCALIPGSTARPELPPEVFTTRVDDAEAQATRWVTEAGGSVLRDEKDAGKPVVAVRLFFREGEGPDAGLKGLAALRHLRELSLNFSDVTDAGLKGLAALKELRELQLRQTKATDAGLMGLTGLVQLATLDLGGTKVTNAGLKELAGLKQLRRLYLDRTEVTDAGLKELAGLKQLRSLDLKGTNVTDAGLAKLQEALPRCNIDGP